MSGGEPPRALLAAAGGGHVTRAGAPSTQTPACSETDATVVLATNSAITRRLAVMHALWSDRLSTRPGSGAKAKASRAFHAHVPDMRLDGRVSARLRSAPERGAHTRPEKSPVPGKALHRIYRRPKLTPSRASTAYLANAFLIPDR
jgi:hypothetical protein